MARRKMSFEINTYDAADYLGTPERIAAYLSEALASGDTDIVAKALGTVIRAQNASVLSRKAGVSRQSLRNATQPGANPTLDTLMKVTGTMGFRLALQPAKAA